MMTIALLLLAGSLFAQNSLNLEVNTGVYGGAVPKHFPTEIADIYGTNWLALRVPLQTAQTWESLPPLVQFDLRARDPQGHWEVLAKLPLRKDLEAWYQSSLRTNVPISTTELDINVPIEAWGRWQSTHWTTQAGRFKPEWGPSPHGMVLSGAPWHDAFWTTYRQGSIRFDWLLSSLDGRLLGTPEQAGDDVPTGSEAWQQRTFSISNQRNRSYTQPHKNLLVHRLEFRKQAVWVSVTEQTLVGGKPLDLRDLNPFSVWHNNYGDGYSKSGTTLELGLRPLARSTLYWQASIEDFASPVGETEGEVAPTTMGLLVGWHQIWNDRWNSRFDVARTDPSFNNHRLPLLRLTSRRYYRSNFRAQDQPDFADTYVVDYPIGYLRGPDALDLWLDVERQGKINAKLALAWLRQGQTEVYDSWDSIVTDGKRLRGIMESQGIADLQLRTTLRPSLHAEFSVGARVYQNLEHISEDNGIDGFTRFGLTYQL